MDAMYTAGAHMTKHLQENFDGYDRFFSWISFAADPPRNVLWYYPIALTFSNPLGVRILIAASCSEFLNVGHQVDPERAPSILVRQDEVRHRHPARPDAADLRNRAGFSFGTRHGHRGRPVRRDPLRHKLRRRRSPQSPATLLPQGDPVALVLPVPFGRGRVAGLHRGSLSRTR
ncbi:hypothetical protein MRX96_011114 [Rhipicephalus microplus]